jgi:succinate dehydrogenase/fumarate reductase flavoprotein subunit
MKELTADVLIAGYGGSGIVAALTAYDAGASVLILEKAPIGGGVTKISDTNFSCPSDMEEAYKYWRATVGTGVSEEICRATAEEACKNIKWLAQMGIRCSKPIVGAEFPDIPGQSSMTFSRPVGSSARTEPTKGAHGGILFDALDEHRRDRGIEVLYNTPVTALVQDSKTAEIRGVLAKCNGETISVKTRRAVILCTGDFSNNQDMIRNYLRPYPMKFVGWKYSTGDGIVIALKAGAKLWHMNTICGHYCLDIPEFASGYACFGGNPPSWIFVDKYGRRFANEDERMSHNFWTHYAEMDWDNLGFLRVPSYMIFDENRRAAGPVAASFTSWLPVDMGGNVPWSTDNLAEIEKGWVMKGNTIEELASDIGGFMDPAVLRRTVDIWNSGCIAGIDTGYGRSPDTSSPLSKPPYFAVKLMPGQSNTMGGPERNEKCQVLDHNNSPIPRLYEAGDLGGIFGTYAAGGGNIGVLVMAHGRIAGRNAAGEHITV